MDHKKIDLSTMKKDEKFFKKRALTDEQLDNISGGYWEDSGYAAGYWIQCPACGRSKASDFNTWADSEVSCDFFTCKCGYVFAVDEFGTLYGSTL